MQNSLCKAEGRPKTDDSYVFLEDVSKLMLEELKKAESGEGKVTEYQDPPELLKKIDLSIGYEGETNDSLLENVRNVVRYSVKTAHPHFFNQLFAGPDPYGVAGAWATEALNTYQYTYEVGPVFTLMESFVLKRMTSYVGFEDGEGIFCPGGSVSNMYALNLARNKMFPHINKEGMGSLAPLCVFASDQCHYSIEKGMAFLGMGSKYLIRIKSDERGLMRASGLDQAIQKAKSEGLTPVMVTATAGSTVIGGLDPMDEIADVCQKHQIWMHVDGCWGASVLMSPKHKHLMDGVHRADSIAWNPHKMLGIPVQCAAFLTAHKGLLKKSHSAGAHYLFPKDRFYDVSLDTGDASVQCGRKIDVLKLWLAWKARGDRGMEERIDRAFENAEYLADRVRKTEGFRLLFEPQLVNVCFHYIPPSLRGQEETPEWHEKLNKVAPKIKERFVKEGTMMLTYQPNERFGLVNFWRMTAHSFILKKEDMDFVLSEIVRLGEDL